VSDLNNTECIWNLSNISSAIRDWLNQTIQSNLGIDVEMVIAGIAVIGLFAQH
jgi:hypothetical protein